MKVNFYKKEIFKSEDIISESYIQKLFNLNIGNFYESKKFISKNDKTCFSRFLETNFNIFTNLCYSQLVYVDRDTKKRIYRQVFWLSAENFQLRINGKPFGVNNNIKENLMRFRKEIKLKIIFLDRKIHFPIIKEIFLILTQVTKSTKMKNLFDLVKSIASDFESEFKSKLYSR